MNLNYQSPRERQYRHMKVILKMEGPLLTNEQKKKILEITRAENIIMGFEAIDRFKALNRGVKKP